MILYQLLMALALPVLLAHQALFGARGALGERLGLGPAPMPGLRLWLHAASVGEVTSARWVIEALVAARPGLQVLVTTNTATGRAQVQRWALPGVTAALAPFDSAGAAGRVLDRWRPQALVIVENELWPARLRAADNRGVPVLVIGARISARSARRWAALAGLIRPLLEGIDWVSAQDAESLARLQALGLPAQAAGPVMALKSIATSPPEQAQSPFPPPARRAETLLAASTHEGEEGPVLDAYLASGRFSHLILAPRHPQRGEALAGMLKARGIRFAQRSKGEVPGPGTQVYLADTLGEMAHWYAMAGATVIGGSFAARGGHTPWEPARQGSAILHGPSLHNFAAPFAALDRAGGAIAVSDVADLGRALAGLDDAAQTRLARTAAEVLAPEGDGSEVIAALLQALKG